MAAAKQSKLYVLSDNEIVKNSPYTAEGTDIVLDIPPTRNVPHEYDAEINGASTRIRYVRGSNTIVKSEQIALGYPANRKPTNDELSDLVIKNGVLLATRANLIQYLDTIPINEAAQERPSGSRNYFRPDDSAERKKLEFAFSRKKSGFINQVYNTLSDEQVLDLVRLRYHKNVTTDPEDARMELERIISEDPDGAQWFEANYKPEGEQSELNKLVVLAAKARELDVISLGILPGSIAMKSSKGKWEPILTTSEPEEDSRFSRLVDFLGTKDGKNFVELIEKAISTAEAKISAKKITKEPAEA